MGEVKSKSNETGALKYDGNKPPIHYIPREGLILAANAFDYGAKKYLAYNYMHGFKYTRLIDACMRHVIAFTAGEDNDPESGVSHVGHALATLNMLAYMMEHHKDLDDRPQKPEYYINKKLENKKD